MVVGLQRAKGVIASQCDTQDMQSDRPAKRSQRTDSWDADQSTNESPKSEEPEPHKGKTCVWLKRRKQKEPSLSAQSEDDSDQPAASDEEIVQPHPSTSSILNKKHKTRNSTRQHSGEGSRAEKHARVGRGTGDESEDAQLEDTSAEQLNVEELVSCWEHSLVDLRSRVLSVSSDEKVAQDLKAAHIGDVYLQFVRPGAVDGVLDLDTDPNFTEHVAKLYYIISCPIGKKDHEALIIVCMPCSLIVPEVQANMVITHAEDLLSEVPLLHLKDIGDEEVWLEKEIWMERTAGRWLDTGKLTESIGCLKVLRQQRTRATLLNGNHRTRAMLRIMKKHLSARSELHSKIEKGVGNQADLLSEQVALNVEVERHTWRVKVLCVATDAPSPH
ncbi:hypothetical protein FRC06_004110 [Ceratobasidium sp. 370]|nr:hypothetical protein FRC06_004110 [Ceratobasidium sp. 370]